MRQETEAEKLLQQKIKVAMNGKEQNRRDRGKVVEWTDSYGLIRYGRVSALDGRDQCQMPSGKVIVREGLQKKIIDAQRLTVLGFYD